MADDATTPNGSAPEPNEIEPNEIQEVGPSLFRVPLITPTLPPATRTNMAGGLSPVRQAIWSASVRRSHQMI